MPQLDVKSFFNVNPKNFVIEMNLSKMNTSNRNRQLSQINPNRKNFEKQNDGVTGIILAGGASRRMGTDKALLSLDGHPLIEIISDRLRSVVDEVIVVADNGHRFELFADRWVADIYPGVGTLGGIHAGLKAASYHRTLIVGCDMPFLNVPLLDWFSNALVGYDLVVLKQGEQMETLHAAYSKSCLYAVEEAIKSGKRRVNSFYHQVKARFVDPAEIEALGFDLISFRNINTSNEWKSVVEEPELAIAQNSFLHIL